MSRRRHRCIEFSARWRACASRSQGHGCEERSAVTQAVTAVKGECFILPQLWGTWPYSLVPDPLHHVFLPLLCFSTSSTFSRPPCPAGTRRLTAALTLVKAGFVVNELPLLLGTSRARLCNLDLIRHLIKSAWSLICSDSGGHSVVFEEPPPPF